MNTNENLKVLFCIVFIGQYIKCKVSNSNKKFKTVVL